MDFKNEVLKILNKIINNIDENAVYYKKEVEAIRRCQEKSENSFPETKPELKAMNRRRNAEERISDLENSDKNYRIKAADRMQKTKTKKPNIKRPMG